MIELIHQLNIGFGKYDPKTVSDVLGRAMTLFLLLLANSFLFSMVLASSIFLSGELLLGFLHFVLPSPNHSADFQSFIFYFLDFIAGIGISYFSFEASVKIADVVSYNFMPVIAGHIEMISKISTSQFKKPFHE